MQAYFIDFDERTTDETVEGRMWHRSDANEFRMRTGGVTFDIRDATKLQGKVIDPAAIADKFVLQYDLAGNKIIYKSVSGLVADIELGFSATFFDSGTDYISANQRSWQVIASFEFAGTDNFDPAGFRAILSRNGTNGSGSVRIWDFTNAAQIAILDGSVTDDAKSFYGTTSFTNLPTARSVFELQARKDNAGDSATRVHEMKLF